MTVLAQRSQPWRGPLHEASPEMTCRRIPILNRETNLRDNLLPARRPVSRASQIPVQRGFRCRHTEGNHRTETSLPPCVDAVSTVSIQISPCRDREDGVYIKIQRGAKEGSECCAQASPVPEFRVQRRVSYGHREEGSHSQGRLDHPRPVFVASRKVSSCMGCYQCSECSDRAGVVHVRIEVHAKKTGCPVRAVA